MRQFSAVLESPKSCGCCGTSLPASDLGISRDKFRLEFPEGSELSFGQGLRITATGGKLRVSLRQKHGSGRGWALRPHYNDVAFARVKIERSDDKDAGYSWYTFVFDLAKFKPSFSTWWAELQFFEVDPFKKGFNGEPVESHNAASVRVKLETLE